MDSIFLHSKKRRHIFIFVSESSDSVLQGTITKKSHQTVTNGPTRLE